MKYSAYADVAACALAAALLALAAWLTFSPPVLKARIELAAISAPEQHLVTVPAPALGVSYLRSASDGAAGPARSRLIVYEDTTRLGPAHAQHADIRAAGGGRYSHWNGALYFSSSDNTDPRSNGRVYWVAERLEAPVWLWVMAALALGIAVARIEFARKGGNVPGALPAA